MPDDLEEYVNSGGVMSEVGDIDVTELTKLLSEDKVSLLDVRRASELEEFGYIEGTENIAHTVLMKRLTEIPEDKPVAVYCMTGARAKYASSFLKKSGYEPLQVQGGIMAWMSAGYDVAGK